MHLHLPSEILAIILRELASDDENNNTRAALASCRLASHVLYSLATPFLFSSIRLTDATGNKGQDCSVLVERAMKLNQVLTDSNIASSVHTLTLCCSQQTLANPTSAILMSTILRRLPHVRTFTLKSESFFSSIPRDFALAIQSLCESPNLTTLNLDSIKGFPYTVITSNLRCLRLRRVDNFWFDKINSALQHLSLDSLEIDRYNLYFLGIRVAKDNSIAKHFSQIKNLLLEDLFLNASILSCGWTIILLVSKTLIKLDLSLGHNYGSEQVLHDVSFNLGLLPALRHLKVHRRTSCLDSLAPLRFLTQLLSIPSSSSGIEVLEIGITWYDVKHGHGKDLFLDRAWSTLDLLLTCPTFGSLRKVVLRLDLLMLEVDANTRRSFRNDPHQPDILESERNVALSYVNNLLPLFRADTRRTLESHLEVAL